MFLVSLPVSALSACSVLITPEAAEDMPTELCFDVHAVHNDEI